jgi:hypothetical protein
MTVLLAVLALLQDKGESVSFSTIDKGSTSGFTSPLEMFLTSQKDWVDLWAKREVGTGPKKNAPTIDFDKDIVIVAALGMKNTGGYTIEITRIVRTPDDLTVYVKRTEPAAGSTPSGKPTSPFVLAKIRKPDKPVTFRDEDKK